MEGGVKPFLNHPWKEWEEFIYERNMKYVESLDICVTVQDRVFLKLIFLYFPNSVLIWVHPKTVSWVSWYFITVVAYKNRCFPTYAFLQHGLQ